MKIGVIIPCYKVSNLVGDVLSGIGSDIDRIYVVDDHCPENSGHKIASTCQDPRVHVLYHNENKGVGGAVITGYRAAMHDGMDIIIKIDGDGQMDPAHIQSLIRPILKGRADYTKGNRFFSYEHLGNMPAIRLIGNGALSFLSKLSSGYWNIVDPANGYTAIHRIALSQLPLEKISEGYFFENDMLFRLNSIRAVVIDVPIKAIYGSEKSNLQEHKVLIPFLFGHMKNFLKRIGYTYFVRDVSFASLELVFGLLLITFGMVYGGFHWVTSVMNDIYAPSGVVMLPALTVILGMQLLLSAINYDIQNVPKWPLQMLQGDE